MDFISILNHSLQQDVSDVFLTDGHPISVRRHGAVQQLEQFSEHQRRFSANLKSV